MVMTIWHLWPFLYCGAICKFHASGGCSQVSSNETNGINMSKLIIRFPPRC